MDELTRGTWIINSVKHFLDVKVNSPELSLFESTELAGKAGLLLGRLVAEEQEVVPAAKARVFARESGITRGELPTCFELLRRREKVDFTIGEDGLPGDVEVYCFSLDDSLRQAALVFDDLGPGSIETAGIDALEYTFHLPRTAEELQEELSKHRLGEPEIERLLAAQTSLSLLKTNAALRTRPLYFNEYLFADTSEKIHKALDSLRPSEREEVEAIQSAVEGRPGLLLDTLTNKHPKKIVNMMEGIGLLDIVTVESPFGNAAFATLPQLQGVSISRPILSADVFHKAKLLLGCLRYGEVKSLSSRGRIGSFEKMMNIVNKLNRLEWVGPCEAIGQDYQLLERDGVIQTQRDKGNMYLMRLRQREVGVVVRQMMLFGNVLPHVDIEAVVLVGRQPISYVIPEKRRTDLQAKQIAPVAEIRQRILESIRS